MLLELLYLAVLSAFWPTLLVIDVIAFRTPRPVRTLAGFLVGGLVTATTIGTLIVVNLEDGPVFTRSRSSLDTAAYVACGLVAFAAAFVVARRRPRKQPDEATKPSMTERAIERGAGVAFAAGVLLNIVPGVFPIVALKDIAQLDYSTRVTFTVVTAFYLVMFALVEIPIVGYGVAPEQTERRVTNINAWLGTNMQRIAVWGLVAGGVYLIGRGVAQLL
jgi:hypothetical protein